MDLPKIEIEFPISKDNQVEFVTHNGNLGDGCSLYVYIDGNTAYEVTLLKKDLKLTVKEYDGEKLFEKDLEPHWYGEETC